MNFESLVVKLNIAKMSIFTFSVEGEIFIAASLSRNLNHFNFPPSSFHLSLGRNIFDGS